VNVASAGQRCLLGERRTLYRVSSGLAERKSGYRARAYANDLARAAARAAVSERAEARVQAREAGQTEQRWQRMSALCAELSVLLEGHSQARQVWLRLDEVQHAYWIDVSVEHYNLGYEAGRAQASVDALHGGPLAASDRARALAAALSQLADTLDTSDTVE